MSEEKAMADRLAAEVQTALEGAVQLTEGGILTRWVCVLETIGPDSERGVWAFAEKSMLPWEAYGMLRYAETVETSRQVAMRLDDDEPGL